MMGRFFISCYRFLYLNFLLKPIFQNQNLNKFQNPHPLHQMQRVTQAEKNKGFLLFSNQALSSQKKNKKKKN